MFPEAIAELETASKLEPRPWTMASVGYALAVAGRAPEALRMAEKLKSQSAQQYVSPLGIAIIHIGLRQPDVAREWLERAYRERTDVLVWLKRDPIFDPMRAHPQFQALVRRMASLAAADALQPPVL